jgi:alkylation response protein AidB-like acyl-CoA dehydrogenase
VLEEIGRNLSPSPFLSTAVAAVEALKTSPHRELWYPGILAGDTVASLALEDTSKFADSISLRATRSGNGFSLSGTKNFVHHAHVADLMIISARTSGSEMDEMGVTMFAVDPKSLEIQLDPQRLADSSIASRATFADIQVDADTVLGEVDQGREVLNRLLAAGRTGASSELLGVGGGAMDMTVNYLKQRKQFGVPIGSFQALQHRAAHLYSEMEVARAAVLKAQQLLDAGEDAAEAVAVAKAMTGLATSLAVQEGVQMHGGIGMTDAHDAGFYLKRARACEAAFGSQSYHRDRYARIQGY